MRKCGEKEGTSSASDQLYTELKPHCDTVCGVTSMGDYEVSFFCLILVGIFTLIFGLVWFGGGGAGDFRDVQVPNISEHIIPQGSTSPWRFQGRPSQNFENRKIVVLVLTGLDPID
ncbi:hypothetical protein P167DRAFT_112877 [Morchella conica CCBAS932]|uniref:Uncharacterized protein n=1 Tax=Morchella conica CCBAS932 TaxID=1392247 RepID=A0A3N4KS25_9PEZI|nr:hypothetical protein P167DRAFT_112877 [Morchella conica CCBAS932]